MSKFRRIEAEKGDYPISLMCELLEVLRSGFRAGRRPAPSQRQLSNDSLLERIRHTHAEKSSSTTPIRAAVRSRPGEA